MYKNYSNLDNEISDESTDKTDVNNGCKILDGKKSRRRRKSKNKSRKKSIRHKKK
jgi:hypothetical protein